MDNKLNTLNQSAAIAGHLGSDRWDNYGNGLQYENESIYAIGEFDNNNSKLQVTLNDLEWHHITAIFTSSGKLYLDGLEVDSGNLDPGIVIGYPFGIAASRRLDENAKNFKGTFDEVRISNTVRSASWVKATYHSELNQLMNYGAEELIPPGFSQGDSSLDIEVLFDPAILRSIVSHVIIIKCVYSNLSEEKVTTITVTAQKHNTSRNYYDSFGHIGDSNSLFSSILVGTRYANTSIFYLNVDDNTLEKILKGTVVLNIKNNEIINITNIYIYLDGELSINEIYGSSLLV
jgi:hypothetical protein